MNKKLIVIRNKKAGEVYYESSLRSKKYFKSCETFD